MVFCYVLSFFVFLYIINKDDPPEFKLPWLIIMLLLPLFGLMTYVLFANPRMNRKQMKRLVSINQKTLNYVTPTQEHGKEVAERCPEFIDFENYLNKTSYSYGSFSNKVTYFKSGEDMFPNLLADLESAEKFIFIEYFIIAEGSMWNQIYEILKRKVAQGVEVRVMYDDIGNAGLQKTEYYRKLRKEGINCCKFNSFHPVVSGIFNFRDHRKITVIDGKVAYTGGLNIADEYINLDKKLGYWKDTAIKIQGPAVANLTTMFLQLFDVTSKKLSDYEKYLGIEYEKYDDEGYVCVFGDGPKPYYKEQVGENVFINMINKAKKYVYITTPYFIIDYALTNALRNASMRGIDVRIITPHTPDKKIIFNITRSKFPSLLDAGVKFYEFMPGFIHAKSILVDDELAFVGTINLDYRSLVHHFECGALLYKTPCIKDIKDDFEHTMNLSKELTRENCKQSAPVRLVNALIYVFRPML
ncbi:MAG: cardiolipin synthase [Candidatus Coproplasma sp.]